MTLPCLLSRAGELLLCDWLVDSYIIFSLALEGPALGDWGRNASVH